jgi:protocatechuate 3,4-dioxygenase beta subunit
MTDCRTRFIALVLLTWVLAAVVCDGLVVAQSGIAGPPVVSHLAGRVVDSNGDPVADAEVFWEIWRRDQPLPLIEGRSGPDGSFALQSNESAASIGRVWIHSSRHALKLCEATDLLLADQKRSPNTVTLNASAPMRIHLLDPNGRPLAGELIEPEKITFDHSNYPVAPRLREVLGGVTDADGIWQTNCFDQSSWMNVRVVSEEFGVQMQRLQSRRPDPASQLKLMPVGSIVGRIATTEPGRFAGKTVKVVSSVGHPEGIRVFGDPEGKQGDFNRGEATVEIDREGRFRVPAIIGGNVSCSVTTPTDAEWVTEVGRIYELKEGVTREIEVLAVQKVPFQGTILLSNGAPAEGVRLKLTSGAHWPVVDGVTDREGKFYCWVCPGDVSLEGYLPRYGGVRVLHQSASVSSVTRGVSSNDSTVVAETLRLPVLVLVEGTVVDRSGKAIPKATLEIWQNPTEKHQLSTDADGRFRIYRPEKATLNQFSVSINGKQKVTSQEYGDPLVVRVLE